MLGPSHCTSSTLISWIPLKPYRCLHPVLLRPLWQCLNPQSYSCSLSWGLLHMKWLIHKMAKEGCRFSTVNVLLLLAWICKIGLTKWAKTKSINWVNAVMNASDDYKIPCIVELLSMAEQLFVCLGNCIQKEWFQEW